MPSQDSFISQCLLSSLICLLPSLILLPVWRGEEWHKVYLAEHYRCVGELETAGVLPAIKVDTGCLVVWARYYFETCFFTLLSLEEFCTSVTFYALLSSIQIGPKIPKLSFQC